jgi:hypothetical protein
MIVVLTILVAIIGYFTWRTSVAIWRINNMLGVVMDAMLKLSSRTDTDMDEVRRTLENVSRTFAVQFPWIANPHNNS